MAEPLIYVQTGGRLQPLYRLTEGEKATILAGQVERIHVLTTDGATTEDEATGKVHKNGKYDANDRGGRLASLRAKHPMDPKVKAKGGK